MPLYTILFRLLAYTALISITILAFLPNYDALPPIVSFSDLLNHAVAFFVLFILFREAHPKLQVSYRIVLLLFYAIFIEVVQYFLPTRFSSFSDILADSFGLLLAYLFHKLIYKLFKQPHLE